MSGDVFRMHVLAAGHGDCLWVDYGAPAEPTRILIDAGTPGTFKRLKPALDAVRSASESHDLFIVTHIDADHLGGALAVLEDYDTARQFKQIWFNGRKHLLQAQDLQPFGAVQGERLTRALLTMEGKWNTAFSNNPVMRSGTGTLPSYKIGEGTVTVLTPSAVELAGLLGQWDNEIKAAGLAPGESAPRPKILRPGWQAFGVINVDLLADTVVPEDSAAANGSSIATLVEFNGKRLLLGADAHPSVLLNGIRLLQPSGRLTVDAFKLPHHGSSANVTDELLDAVDTKTVVFSSNGAYFKHPDQVAVARVIRRYKTEGVHLVFNYRTTFNRMWDSAGLRKKWNYTSEYGVGEQGVTVRLM